MPKGEKVNTESFNVRKMRGKSKRGGLVWVCRQPKTPKAAAGFFAINYLTWTETVL